MAYNDKLKMDPDAVNAVAANVEDTQLTAADMAKFPAESKLAEKDFGNTSAAAGAGKNFLDAVKTLTKSLGKADHFLHQNGLAMRATAQAQTVKEEDTKWGFDKLNKGN